MIDLLATTVPVLQQQAELSAAALARVSSDQQFLLQMVALVLGFLTTTIATVLTFITLRVKRRVDKAEIDRKAIAVATIGAPAAYAALVSPVPVEIVQASPPDVPLNY